MSAVERAAVVLDALAEGREPEHGELVAAALVLDTIAQGGGVGRDLLDAAHGLRILAEGGRLDLDEAGRRRAGDLAGLVRSRWSVFPAAGLG